VPASGLRPVEDAAVVVTGASSGIGRSAALKFAARGSSLALAARDRDDLDTVREECERAGADAIAIETDVGDENAVEELARSAEQCFGRVDVWVNDAGVMAFGPFEEIPSEIFRRVIETNLFGQVHGARAALPRFRSQGAGVLINLSSVWGRVTTPQVSPYVVSKHAISAFSECLRHELDGVENVHVVTIAPQAVDTPIFEHAANYTGRRIRPIPPLWESDQVADGIVRCAEDPKREVAYGHAGRALEVAYATLPRLYCKVAPSMWSRGTLTDEPAERSDGNVLRAAGGGRSSDGWKQSRGKTLRQALIATALGFGAGLAGRGARSIPRLRSR
jgi:NAD(P)-dependent dehydrogenase (short-subunit alcohol dehydrogenase family)